VVFFVVEVGVFASEHVGRLAERDLLALSPILFVGFALWLERGAPRPRATTAAVGVLTLAPLLLLPVKRLVVEAAAPDAPPRAPPRSSAAGGPTGPASGRRSSGLGGSTACSACPARSSPGRSRSGRSTSRRTGASAGRAPSSRRRPSPSSGRSSRKRGRS